MLKSIGIGAESFHKLIENDCYYVDKTPFIRTVFKENKADVMLITRPRRFGKTLTMSTFYDFLSLNIENPGDVSLQEKWFKDTKIIEDREFCNEFMGRFPVIFLTLKSVAFDNFNDSYSELARVINSMALNFSYLRYSSELETEEKESLQNLLTFKHLRDISNISDLTGSLVTLTNLLYKHHKICPILLIDEYDVPVAKAAHFGYYREMINVVGQLLATGLKGNTNMKTAVLTGCLRAAKESIFTGLNNLFVCSILDSGDDDISSGIGFTKEEAEEVLSYYGLTDYYGLVGDNYDGYYFGDVHMYCPWDVMSFCRGNYKAVGKENKNITAGNYWINTSGNDVIEEFMGFIEPKDVDLMQELLDGKSITAEVRATLCYGDLQNHDINDFWTLLLYTGYLTFDPTYRSSKKNEYSLYIPNEEIRDCFRDKILAFFKTNSVMKASTGELVKGLFEGDAEKVQDNLNTLLGKYVSIRDFSVNAPKENYYHGFMNGLLVNGISLIEEQKSNFESGDGYIDLIIKSVRSIGTIVILELKQTSDENEDKVLIAQDAVEQIIQKKYAAPYIKRNDIKAVLTYGICFCKKECAVVEKKLK